MSEVYVKEPSTNGKAIFRTTHGDLEIEMWATETPKACRNFCQLILEGYYNGTIFHRVIKDFIVQGGDATNTGDGSESIYGQPYPDEIHPRLKFRYRGMMGVASAGKGTKTNGSQFFMVLNRAASLDGKHTLFAKVVGQTVYNLVRISEVEVDKLDRPLEPPRVIRAELVWDPFGDLEPRRLPSPPRAIKPSTQEVSRRAPVRNKKVLSFAPSDGEGDEDGEAGKATTAKGKSAHDLLADPKLSKEAAYPEVVQQRASSSGSGTKRPAEAKNAVVNGAKRPATAPPAAAAAGRPPAAESGGSSGSGSGGEQEDEDGSEEEADDDVAQQRSYKRREAILQLKREIANVGPGAKAEAKSKRPSSALEELRAGYTMRQRRTRPVGKDGKKKEADAIMNTLKSFRNRIQSVIAEGAGEDGDGASPSIELKDPPPSGKPEKEKKDNKAAPEPEEGTFASIWQEGEEEVEKDWLVGGGLKFHVSADKAFKLDRDRARDTLEIFDPLAARGNAEALADARKKASEAMVPLRRKLPQKPAREDERDRRR